MTQFNVCTALLLGSAFFAVPVAHAGSTHGLNHGGHASVHALGADHAVAGHASGTASTDSSNNDARADNHADDPDDACNGNAGTSLPHAAGGCPESGGGGGSGKSGSGLGWQSLLPGSIQ